MNIDELTKVEILADSVGEFNSQHRLITLKIRTCRFILSEILTHRMLSRNAESSRAVPVNKKLHQAMYVPTQFANKVRGMGSGLPLSPTKNLLAKAVWCLMAYCNKLGCKVLSKLNVEKQRANRPLEWFSSIEVIITGDLSSWKHFLSLRLHPDAQPEMQVLAKCIKDAIDNSVPNILRYGEVHIPYDIGIKPILQICKKVTKHPRYGNMIPGDSYEVIYDLEARKNISTGLCAGVSYINEMQVSKALELGKKLKDNKHLSPYEHIATCMPYEQRYFNLQGWKSYRYEIENNEK